MAKYLDENGLRYLWAKIKAYVASKSGVTALQVYPVGAIYMSVNSTNPASLFGGTWEQIAKGQFLAGVNADDADFTAGKTGGVKSNSLSHTHTVNNHTHSMGHTHTVSSHTHSMGHTHTVSSHSHSMGHTHTVNNHAHSTYGHAITANEMPAHTHAEYISYNDPLTHQSTVRPLATEQYSSTNAGSYKTVNVNNMAHSYMSGHLQTSSVGGNAAHSHGDTSGSAPGTGQPSSANTGASAPGTGQPSSANTGGSAPGTGQPSNANTGGTAPGTSASLGTINNLPPYLACYMWKRTA